MAVKILIKDFINKLKSISVRKKVNDEQTADKDISSQNNEVIFDDDAQEVTPEENKSDTDLSETMIKDDAENIQEDKQKNKKDGFKKILKNKWFKFFVIILLMLVALSALAGSVYFSYKKQEAKINRAKVKKEQTLTKKVIEPIDRSNYKVIQLNDFGTANPFNPDQTLDVPKTKLQNADGLLLPPQGDIHDSEAEMVMGTTISGILFDDINSSAIINIEGTEYFVKPNDIVNNYKILSIKPNQVNVKYGNNIYKAGVGELLTKVESNSNIVNLNRKFGGNPQDNVSIKVRKN